MDAAIEGFLLQLLAVDQDLPGVAGGLTFSQFNWRPDAERWSIGQCIEHLNLTTERYLPVLRKAETEARTNGLLRSGPFALGFFERWFLEFMEPPVRRRTRTPQAFVAGTNLDAPTTLERFARLQSDLRECIREAEELDLGRIKVRSQFGPVRWTLNGTFAFVIAHERRHLWQAREIRVHPEFPSA